MDKHKSTAWAMTAFAVVLFLAWKGFGIVSLLTIALPLCVFIRALYRTVGIERDVTASFAKLYTFEVFFPFAWVAILSVAGIMPVTTIISFMALPIAIACTQTMRNSVEGGVKMLVDIYPRMANLHRIYVFLLIAAFAAALIF